MGRSEGIGWLHLSDLHVGMTNQGWMWPTLKHRLFQDLRDVHQRSGPWDSVVFSGDLTQRGASGEFKLLTGILKELWDLFQSLGSNPTLVCVPGNHDLERPELLDPAARILRDWWNAKDVHNDLFENSKSSYRARLQKAFGNYSAWLRQLPSEGISVADLQHGLLPGDTSVAIQVGDQRLGIVGLNSAWLQLSDGDFHQRLHVDARQLLTVTGGDSDAWCAANSFNLLVTHHPASWLHPTSLTSWNAEIHPPSRFDAHIYGHMHEPDAFSVQHGGSEPRTSVQAASVFGLETYSGAQHRTHGYSANRLLASETQVVLRTWPRIAQKKADGSIGFVPNFRFTLDEQHSYEQLTRAKMQVDRPPLASREDLTANTIDLRLADPVEMQHVLNKTELVLPPQPAHRGVRTVEQRLFELASKEERLVWLQVEWGAGEEGFLWTAQQNSSFQGWKVYRLDLSKYVSRQTFLEKAAEELGCGFGQYCDLLSQAGPAFLLLDDVPLTGAQYGDAALAQDINEFAQIILQYCPAVCVVMVLRRKPGCEQERIELGALDEADTRVYIEAHPLGGAKLGTPTVASQLFRHTDGVLSRIDSALKELEVTSLSELLSTNTDAGPIDGSTEVAPGPLTRSVAELSKAESDRVLHRSFSLLKTLSMFPRGEQLYRIKRFLGPHPYLPAHARELVDRGLVEAIPLLEVGTSLTGEVAKTLVVRRPVRDYVRSLMSEEEQVRVNERALDLYFGDQWRNGVYKTPGTLKFSDPGRGVAEILNASMVIVRLLRSAADAADPRKVKEALGVAYFYASALREGGHFRGVITFYEDVAASLSESDFNDELSDLRHRYGQALRMAGETERAVEVLSQIAERNLDKLTKLSVLINLALCYESVGDIQKALAIAKEIIDLDSDSSHALQARAMLVQHGGGTSAESLQTLEATARKRKSFIVANTIALTRSHELALSDVEGIRERLQPVLSTAAQVGDHYNLLRARLRVARSMRAAGNELTGTERFWLIGAYQYLYNQRLESMFDECHQLLWALFDEAKDESNLLRLFRHSSLIWRLESRESMEVKYVKQLAKRFAQQLTTNIREADRETAYFLTRMHLAISGSSDR